MPSRALRWGLFLLLAIALVAGGIPLWLSFRPIPLPFLIPRLEAALTPPDAAFTPRIGHVELGWGGVREGLALSADEVRLHRPDESLLAGLERVGIGLGAWELLQGRLAVSRIILEEPVARLVRLADGGFEIGLGDGGTAAPREDLSGSLLARLAQPPDSKLPLDRISVRRADLRLDDQATGTQWLASRTNLDLVRGEDGVQAWIALAVESDPAHAAGEDRGAPVGIHANLDLRHHQADKEGADEVDVGFEVRVSGFEVDALARWWPEGVAAAGRKWVLGHLHSGRVPEARVEGKLRLDTQPPRTTKLESLTGSLEVTDLDVGYARGWPVVRGVNATGHLDGTELRFDVTSGQAEELRVEEAEVVLSELGSKQFQIDVGIQLHGPLANVARTVDLDPLGAFSRLGLEVGSPPGDARAQVDLTIRPGRKPLLIANDFSLDSRAATLRGRFEPGRGALGIESLVLDPLRVGGSDLGLDLRRSKGTGYRVRLHGARADLSPWLGGGGDGKNRGRTGLLDLPSLSLQADLEQVELGSGRTLHEVRAAGRRDATSWTELDFRAGLDGGREASVTITPSAPGHTLTARSDDFGQILSLFGWPSEMTGGDLSIEASRTGPTAAMAGRVELREAVLTRHPGLTRILQAMSLTGLRDALRGDGLDLDLFEADFRYQDGTLELAQANAYTPSLALRGEGSLDLGEARIDLRGVAVPFDRVSDWVGKVPILGKPLTGGGEGIFAADFRIQGPLADPEVRVSKLSAAAPGILRGLVRRMEKKPASERRPAGAGETEQPAGIP